MTRRYRPASLVGIMSLLLASAFEEDSVARPAAFSMPEPGDLARSLVETLRWNRLETLAAAGAEQHSLTERPWSGWFWPFRDAGIAYRFTDPAFPRGAAWSVVRNYLRATRHTTPIAQMSPAEKYDLLVGDPTWSLTEASLGLAQQQAVSDRIAPWKGLCAGWANAAMMIPRPMRSIDALAADGHTWISFLPDDIKALAALLWARGTFPFRSVGQLCFEDPIETTPPGDRAKRGECRDTNPATFHLSVTNQLAGSTHSLILDSDPGNEIWNQPIAAYAYTFFHPVTEAPGSLTDSRLSVGSWGADPLREFRAVGTRFVIGVEMRVDFIYEKEPTAARVDSPESDPIRSPIYRYELELSETGEIIGGEWKSALHPDILWLPAPNARPSTPGDRELDHAHVPPGRREWDFPLPLPELWRSAAVHSSRQAQPLTRIIEELVTRTAPLALQVQGRACSKPIVNRTSEKGFSP